jgi:hypothetical protein
MSDDNEEQVFVGEEKKRQRTPHACVACNKSKAKVKI